MGPSADKDPPAGPPPGSAGPAGGPGGEKKVFVKSDESWKAEAQKEKERLQKKAAAEEAARKLPPPSFISFVNDLGMQAMLALGLMEFKDAGGPQRDLVAARYTIDILGVLQEKTRGNLSPEERAFLDDLVGNLRLAFVQTSKQEDPGKVVEAKKKIIT